MTDFKFTAEDFTMVVMRAQFTTDDIADAANAKLKEWLDKAPTVEKTAVGYWQETMPPIFGTYMTEKHVVFWAEMLTQPIKGIHTVWLWFSDGTADSYEYYGSPPVIVRPIELRDELNKFLAEKGK